MTNNNIIFIGHSAPDCREKKEELSIILQRADNLIVEVSSVVENDGYLMKELSGSRCGIFILGKQYGERISTDTSLSEVRYQYHLALNHFKKNPDFKLIIWTPPLSPDLPAEQEQLDFINEVRNNMLEGMVFSNSSSPIQLVDDIRTLLAKKEVEQFSVNETEVFIVHNDLDEGEADSIRELLSDVVSVEKLNIVQDSDMDYSEYCSQQIGKSKLAVVYFKESADWALPFAQQVWKKIGGASSHTPILLIGDEDPNSNLNVKFRAPKVISLIVSGELIPLEIKVNFDKAIENQIR